MKKKVSRNNWDFIAIGFGHESARNYWDLFHRLYRMQGKSCRDHERGCQCIVMLEHCSNRIREFYKLMRSPGDRLGLFHLRRAGFPISKELRFNILQRDRLTRLYGPMAEHSKRGRLWMEKDRIIARQLAEEQGIELTSLQVAEERWKLLQEARRVVMRSGKFGKCPSDMRVLRLYREGVQT